MQARRLNRRHKGALPLRASGLLIDTKSLVPFIYFYSAVDVVGTIRCDGIRPRHYGLGYDIQPGAVTPCIKIVFPSSQVAM